MKNYEVKMGRGVQRWESPYDYFTPQPGQDGLCGAFPSIGEALDHPIGSQPLEVLAMNARHMVIVVPDITRGWSHAPDMAKAVRERIAAVSGRPVTWLVSTGQHRAVTEADLPMVFGGAMMDGDDWISHDCDAATDTGLKTPMGTPVLLNQAFIDADLAVLLGGIIHHDMAGFSGGRKNIIPGVSGRLSIITNHCHCLKDGGLNPATDSAILEGNPMAQDLYDYGVLATRGKSCFIVNTIADKTGAPSAWVAGGLWDAWRAGTRAAVSLQTLWAPAKVKRVISSCGGFPNDLDLYQATKAVFSVIDSVEPDGALVMVADLEDSLGPGNFENALRRALVDPKDVLDEMAYAFTIPGYIAARLVIQLSGRPAALVTSREDVPFPGAIFRDVQSADRWLRDVSGTDGLSMLVPSGNSIHVAIQK